MRIIFLDIDGVLNSVNGVIKRSDSIISLGCELQIEHIDPLIWIMKYTDAKLVISSTWRYGKTVEELKDMFRRIGIHPGYVIGKTPRIPNGIQCRGKEIDLWLKNHSREQIEDFVILDDDSDMEPHMDKLVKTNNKYGLTYNEAMEVCVRFLGDDWQPR